MSRVINEQSLAQMVAEIAYERSTDGSVHKAEVEREILFSMHQQLTQTPVSMDTNSKENTSEEGKCHRSSKAEK